MWQTPEGVRVLKGAEAALFKHGLVGLAREPDRSGFDEYFSRLSADTQLQALACVARDLLDSKVSFSGHVAWKEATIHAVYCFLARRSVHSVLCRRLIRQACTELGYFENTRQSLRTLNDYAAAAMGLADLVLWDRDWLQAARASLRADHRPNDYFALPPAPTPTSLREARRILATVRHRRA